MTAYGKENPDWRAQWVSLPNAHLLIQECELRAAPYFRRVFSLPEKSGNARILICGVGFYELYLNGKKVGDHVLDPAVTNYTKRLRYVAYDVTELLHPGENVVGAVLGNGWYNAPQFIFPNYPRMLLQLELDGKPYLWTDSSWKVTSSGPLVSGGVRNGETYDARLELDGWLTPEYDDCGWLNCGIVAGPGGKLEEQTMPPCKVMQILPVKKSWTLKGTGDTVCDFGQNFAGWVKITVSGARGAEVVLHYGERLAENGDVDQERIAIFTKGEFQTDHYILRGNGDEVWAPRFNYHGFQYVKISMPETVTLKHVEGCVVHSAFESAGSFECSEPVLNRMQHCFRWSFISNFVGIPTDCPHREKCGWSGDAFWIGEAGLYNYGAAENYAQWLRCFQDDQLPNGCIHGVIPPLPVDNFTWESGPLWESACLFVPWYIYLYTGNLTPLKENYETVKRYLAYCSSRAEGYILDFGLGDWCHPKREHVHPWRQKDSPEMAPRALLCTAVYYADCELFAKVSHLLGYEDDASYYRSLAENIRTAFNARFHKGNGVYANGCQVAQACPLYYGLVAEENRASAARMLAETVKANDFKIDFGMPGSKYVLRMLAEYGYADYAMKMLCQPEFPGYACRVANGETTLWEQWDGTESLNHPSFGDFSAFFYQYWGGIAPDPEVPGFRHVIIHPRFPEALDWVKTSHKSPFGEIRSEWKRNGEKVELEVFIPAGCSADVILPDAEKHPVGDGSYTFIISKGE